VGIAEEGPDAELAGEFVVLSELGSVVERDGLAELAVEGWSQARSCSTVG